MILAKAPAMVVLTMTTDFVPIPCLRAMLVASTVAIRELPKSAASASGASGEVTSSVPPGTKAATTGGPNNEGSNTSKCSG